MQKKLSLFQIVLLCVFGSLAVVGVLIFAFAVGGSGNASVGKVVIWGTLDATAFQTIIRDAGETDPRLSQVTYVQKDATTYESDLADALSSGTGPDLFLMRQDYAARDAGKAVTIPYTSLSQSQFENTFVQAASPFMGGSGVVGIPILIDPLILYWNRDLLTSAGIAQPVQYWAQLPTQAQTLTKKDDAGNVTTSAIDFGEYQNVDNAKDILAMLILQAGGRITARDTAGHLIPALSATAADSSATQSALRFFTEFADPSTDYYSWNRALSDARQAFAAGTLAYYVGYASEEPLIKQTNPNLNFAVAAMPQVQGSTASIDGGHVYGLAVAKTGVNQGGALTVAYLMAGPSVSQQLSVALGVPSARLDALAQPAQGDDGLFNKMALIARSWVDPDPDQTNSLFQAMIEDTTSGATRLPDAVQRGDQQMAQIMGQ